MFQFRFRAPAARSGQIPRIELLDKVRSVSDVPNLAVFAPAGYGKTTLLRQMEEADERKTAWLTLDQSDSDPAFLMTSLVGSLGAGDLIDTETVERFSNRRWDDALTRGIKELFGTIDRSVQGVLFLDQVDYLGSQSSRDIVGSVMTTCPENLQIVVASRSADGLPIPLLRSRAQLAEVSMADLAFTASEAEALLNTVGVEDVEHLDRLMHRTEGWPAGIYLTATAMRAGAMTPDVREVRGNDKFLANYLKRELLERAPENTVTFLKQSSILTELCGPLCDHVLETEHSSEMLSSLERGNLLIVPLDRTRTWYRYHSLLRDFLRFELQKRHAQELAPFHRRAADWLGENGFPDRAIDHARAAGDSALLGELVSRSVRQAYAEGRSETISKWVSSVEEAGVLADHPELAALTAFARALDGDVAGSERIAEYAFIEPTGAKVPDDKLGPLALMVRAYTTPTGVDRARADARAARASFGRNTDYLHACLGIEALATQAVEGLQAADSLWADGLWRSESLGANPFTSLALAERALAAIDRDDWETAEDFVGRSLDTIRQAQLEGYVTSALGFTLAARMAARNGDFDRATGLLSSAVAIRPLLSVAIPLLAVQTLHEMAIALMANADIAGARRVMRDAADIFAVRRRLGAFSVDHEAIKERLAVMPPGSVGASALTKAELRIVPLMITHLTYPEIGDRLSVSRHTIKTQVISIYRKLGATSRAEAVSRASEIGLINT